MACYGADEIRPQNFRPHFRPSLPYKPPIGLIFSGFLVYNFGSHIVIVTVTMGWFSSFLYSQLFVTLPKPTKDFTGQTIIITGSNTGLGLEAARHISRLNASLVVLAVRNVSKGAAAKLSILESTGRHPSSIEVWYLDLQSYDSVRIFAERANKLSRIDAVLENAGIMTKYFKLIGGFESTITINVISTVLLSLLLLPKLEESARKFNIKPRISIVASDLHFVVKFPEGSADDIFDALNDEKLADMSMER